MCIKSWKKKYNQNDYEILKIQTINEIGNLKSWTQATHVQWVVFRQILQFYAPNLQTFNKNEV